MYIRAFIKILFYEANYFAFEDRQTNGPTYLPTCFLEPYWQKTGVHSTTFEWIQAHLVWPIICVRSTFLSDLKSFEVIHFESFSSSTGFNMRFNMLIWNFGHLLYRRNIYVYSYCLNSAWKCSFGFLENIKKFWRRTDRTT